MPLPTQSLAVVGTQFDNKKGPTRRFEIELCRPGEPIELRPEPKNPADEHAVAVYSIRGLQIGYIKAERAAWIGGMIRQGREMAAIFQESTSWGAVVRVAFDGEVPTLPTKRDSGDSVVGADDSDIGFWPDEEWPE
jgi:hypothetical protein